MIKRFAQNMNKYTGSIYSIEGNIACGKSTILDHLKFKNDKSIYCMQEPVSEWTNMKCGTDVLKLFYEEKDRWGFSFENLVQLSRLKSHYECNKILSKNGICVANDNGGEKNMKIFMERSILSSFNVFTLNTYDENGLEKLEFDILNRYFALFKKEYTTNTYDSKLEKVSNKIIYIHTSPEVAFTRLKMRSRNSEDTINLEYLTKIHQKYEDWIDDLKQLDSSSVKIIDGNLDKKQVVSQIDKILQSD